MRDACICASSCSMRHVMRLFRIYTSFVTTLSLPSLSPSHPSCVSQVSPPWKLPSHTQPHNSPSLQAHPSHHHSVPSCPYVIVHCHGMLYSTIPNRYVHSMVHSCCAISETSHERIGRRIMPHNSNSNSNSIRTTSASLHTYSHMLTSHRA